MPQAGKLPALYLPALPDPRIRAVAYETTHLLAGILKTAVVRTQGHGGGQRHEMTVGISLELHLVFADAVPYSKLV